MIPKVIHYCWFGGSPLPEDVKQYIKSWKKHCPDYEIIQWNESNFDVSVNAYTDEAYKTKKWAFVSDFARLKVLYDFGGIYLDTDVEVLKKFDELLDNEAFVCSESEYSICTAIIGAVKKSEFIKKIIKIYENKNFIENGKVDTKPNSKIIYELVREEYGYKFGDEVFEAKDCVIYPSFYFSPINCYTLKTNVRDETYCIHRYAGSWKSKNERNKDKLLALVTRLLGEEKREKLKNILKGI